MSDRISMNELILKAELLSTENASLFIEKIQAEARVKALEQRVAALEAAAQGRPMSQAPKDKSILAQLLPPYYGWDVIRHAGPPWADRCWSGARGIVTEKFIAGWWPLPGAGEAP